MSRILVALPLLSAIALAGCAGTQEKEEAATGPGATPTCGDWVLVVESPVVASGDYRASDIQNALMDGLEAGGCPAVTSRPSSPPEGATVLVVSSRITSAGGDAGRVSASLTDAFTGEVRSRFQEKTSGDGTDATEAMGREIAQHLAGGSGE